MLPGLIVAVGMGRVQGILGGLATSVGALPQIVAMSTSCRGLGRSLGRGMSRHCRHRGRSMYHWLHRGAIQLICTSHTEAMSHRGCRKQIAM